MKQMVLSSKMALFAIAFFAMGITQQANAQTPVGTWEVVDWFEEVFNSVNDIGGEANLHLYGADRNKQQVRLVCIRDGFTPPPNKIIGIVLHVYLTEYQYARAVDCLQRGKKVEFRWDGNPTTGYLRQYKN